MRKLSLLGTGVCSLLLLTSAASAEDARVSYDRGTKLEFPDAGVKTKMNVQLQPKYSYTDYDDAESRDLEDKSDAEMRRARIILSGDLLHGDVSYKLQNDFVGSTDDDGDKESELKDAWIQFNADEAAKIRFGQFKVAYSRQNLASSAALQFIERSIASREFDLGRDAGGALLGELGDGIEYLTTLTNGESDDEGLNRQGVDTNVLWAAIISLSQGGYNREYEGDPEHTNGLAWTAGAAVSYGQGEISDVDVDTTRLGADMGIRTEGFSLQGEYYWRQLDPDSSDKADDNGFYIQSGYFIVPKEWEVAARFAALYPDADNEDSTEYTLVIGRFLSGHDLKVQTGVTFLQQDQEGGSDVTDFRYELMATAYL